MAYRNPAALRSTIKKAMQLRELGIKKTQAEQWLRQDGEPYVREALRRVKWTRRWQGDEFAGIPEPEEGE